MKYLIRECQPADLNKVIQLCIKHAEYEKASYNPEGKEEKLKEELFSMHPRLFCLVVEVNGTVVGYTSYTIDFSTWNAGTFLYMDCLFLAEEIRGFGIGEAIIKKLRQIATAKNCVNMQWHTPQFNERAINFYRRFGGTVKDKVRFYLDI
ncbi:GNAT family N-acetyltransferase [Flavobacterium sp.]|uniref:GNAT family N-acetyltransferase n=1 Tax=Flavobacterium sp. TaxID=239 RepID=UPI002C700BBC|nr:GNAT family N-acetyltransferase [Flavobacterium sp.]HSD09108.1 GNAT family N-acetyltransferase [Flavobacterium sp.]